MHNISDKQGAFSSQSGTRKGWTAAEENEEAVTKAHFIVRQRGKRNGKKKKKNSSFSISSQLLCAVMTLFIFFFFLQETFAASSDLTLLPSGVGGPKPQQILQLRLMNLRLRRRRQRRYLAGDLDELILERRQKREPKPAVFGAADDDESGRDRKTTTHLTINCIHFSLVRRTTG